VNLSRIFKPEVFVMIIRMAKKLCSMNNANDLLMIQVRGEYLAVCD
jgi:hypothetical protein